MISARCVALDLHTIAPTPLECTCWRWFAVQWGDCQKSCWTGLLLLLQSTLTRMAVSSIGIFCCWWFCFFFVCLFVFLLVGFLVFFLIIFVLVVCLDFCLVISLWFLKQGAVSIIPWTVVKTQIGLSEKYTNLLIILSEKYMHALVDLVCHLLEHISMC